MTSLPIVPSSRSPRDARQGVAPSAVQRPGAARSPEIDDWRWQLRNAATTTAELEQRLSLTEHERQACQAAERAGFPISVTPYYLDLCDPVDARCPIRRQVVPVLPEGEPAVGDLRDPLGEEAHEVAPGLIQRYPDRALMVCTDQCAVYCRFCTRSRLVGGGTGAKSRAALEPAFDYLRAHPEVRDVILSGGDVLTLATDRLRRLVEWVREIDSVETIRLATRVPVVLPQRIDDELCQALKPHHPLWVMTHFNHPRELTPESIRACNRLADHGFPVMNQSVLLRGINDDAATLSELFRGLVRQRVRPYYLLQADPVSGTGHLRTPLAVGIRIMGELQGRLSGLALPKFIVDSPGGLGKVPVGPHYIVRQEPGRTHLKSPWGRSVTYFDPPDAPTQLASGRS